MNKNKLKTIHHEIDLMYKQCFVVTYYWTKFANTSVVSKNDKINSHLVPRSNELFDVIAKMNNNREIPLSRTLEQNLLQFTTQSAFCDNLQNFEVSSLQVTLTGTRNPVGKKTLTKIEISLSLLQKLLKTWAITWLCCWTDNTPN